eukprot:802446-Rhodomonas_salina.1
MVPCPGCGRTFSARDRMEIHAKGCEKAQAMNPSSVSIPICLRVSYAMSGTHIAYAATRASETA